MNLTNFSYYNFALFKQVVYSEAYLEPYRTPLIEGFGENSEYLQAFSYFHKKLHRSLW